MIKRIVFTLPRPYFAAGHYNPKIRAAITAWARQHNVKDTDYTVTATADYKMYLDFADDRYYTLWALSWDSTNLPDWCVIK